MPQSSNEKLIELIKHNLNSYKKIDQKQDIFHADATTRLELL